jgi:predicted enzyme related to lactoylglutathione lyase
MQIGYVNVFVRDFERAMAFYGGTLGLPIAHSDAEHGYASFAAGAIQLGIAVSGAEETEFIGRHTGIGFAVADLQAEHTRLVDAGVEFSLPPTRQPWGGFMAVFADPDGNRFYLDEVSAAHP